MAMQYIYCIAMVRGKILLFCPAFLSRYSIYTITTPMKTASERLENAKPLIIEHFDSLGVRVFRHTEMRETLFAHRNRWRLAKSTRLGALLQFMLSETPLTKAILSFPARPETRYLWRDASVYDLGVSLRANAYFSHYTAMSIHGLTDQIPKIIYLNDEQTPKPRGAEPLDQDRLTGAFSRRPRVSQNVAPYGDYRVCILSGKHTGRLGVTESANPYTKPLPTTSIERTLIDIAVRPFYAGGVFEVLRAYERASTRVDVRLLVNMLDQLDYVYPYHQAIGCYMERTGRYSPGDLNLLKARGLEYDFYLTFQMSKPVYVKTWRLYVPKGF